MKQDSFCADILGKFRSLAHLHASRLRLVGSFPVLFDFPRLQTLDLACNSRLVWDLEDLAGLPNLERLNSASNVALTGNLRSLRHLRHKLVKADLFGCLKVEGEFAELYDFVHLEHIDLTLTLVTGDIRTIKKGDLPSMRCL